MDASLVSHDPEIMSGALCFTGTRVPVQNLFDYLEGSSSLAGRCPRTASTRSEWILERGAGLAAKTESCLR